MNKSGLTCGLVTCALLAVPSPAAGQICGGVDATQLAAWGEIFFNERQAPMRTGFEIPRLPSGIPSRVVTDPELCTSVVHEVQQWLTGSEAEAGIRDYGWDYGIYEYGRYVIIPFVVRGVENSDTLPPPPGSVHAFEPTMIPIFERTGERLDWIGLGLW